MQLTGIVHGTNYELAAFIFTKGGCLSAIPLLRDSNLQIMRGCMRDVPA
jgi:hypothetical protein